MFLDALTDALPAYARDLGLNLANLAKETLLTDQQKWGCFLACAHAAGCGPVIRAVEAEAVAEDLDEAVRGAAKTAAAMMAMNNVYFRAIHEMKNAEYQAMPTRLRMNLIANPGAPKTDFELWALAVSAIGGCSACMDKHEGELRKRGMPPAAIQAGLRIAAVVNAVSRVLIAEAA